MPERRFRDMGLTADEVMVRVDAHHNNTDFERLSARAHRLLPLWRKRGLEELQAIAFEDGKASVWWRP